MSAYCSQLPFMNKVSNILFYVIILSIPVFGFIIINRYLQAKNSVMLAETHGKYQIETVKISNIQQNLPKVREICYFETQKDVDNWFSDGVNVKLSMENVSQGKYSMEINWDKKHSYKLYYYHFPRDWQNYGSFMFDVYSSLKEASRLNMRFYDNFGIESYDHPEAAKSYRVQYELKPGWNTLNAKIGDLKEKINTASDRKLIHLYFSERDGTYYIDNMRLER
jgi:hypothetical protein